MLCEECGINPANTTITRITTRGRSTRRLCSSCAYQRRAGKDFSQNLTPNRSGPLGFFNESPFFDLPASYEPESFRNQRETVNIVDYFSQRAQNVLQKAAEETISLNHQVLDTEHLLLALCQEEEVVSKILEELGIKAIDLENYLRSIVTPGSNPVESPSLSPRAKRVLELAFDEARALNHNYIGPEHIFLGLIREGEGLAFQTLAKYAISLSSGRSAVIKLVGKGLAEGEKAKTPSKTPTLDQFSRDLTALAAEGKIDPVVGRVNEISRIISILSRRTKNNPVLIGEPGVGKTAIVEGLAMRIVNGTVPETLSGKRVVAIDLAGMVAGTRYRGEFESRLKKAVNEIIQAKKEVILFIDELHTLVGAGQAEGAIDAANILKPALARGELQAVGATTLSEYKKYVEKDAALERRFQPLIVAENSPEETVEILKGLRDRYEAHHRVKISDEAISVAVSLSDRYLPDRFLPDKAIDLIDEASAEVRLQSIAPPANLVQIEEKIKDLSKEYEAAQRAKEREYQEVLTEQLEKLRKTEKEVREIWERTKGTESPVVTLEDVAQVLNKMTGIPVTTLTEEERDRLLNLEKRLHQRIVNQDEAVQVVAEAIRRARAGLKDPKRPIGSFVFMGPTGVGKTELSRALSEVLYGTENALISLDMSEYQERHSVARLIGSPPGYVGFEEGGQLTEKVRRHPFSIILLDEIEKAHEDVFNLLLQILEDGRLTDGQGRTVDFKNTILIMTSNLGGKIIQKAYAEAKDQEELEEELEELVKVTFRPEFINRIDEFVVFKTLNKEQILQIVDLLLDQTKMLVKAQRITFQVSKDVKTYLAQKGYDPEFGARPLRRVIKREIENPLSDKLISGEFNAGDQVGISLGENNELEFRKLLTKAESKHSIVSEK